MSVSRFTFSPYEVRANPSMCTGCGTCVDVCEKGVFVLGDDGLALVFDEQLCSGCRVCVEQCPSRALSVTPQELV